MNRRQQQGGQDFLAFFLFFFGAALVGAAAGFGAGAGAEVGAAARLAFEGLAQIAEAALVAVLVGFAAVFVAQIKLGEAPGDRSEACHKQEGEDVLS